MILYLSSYFAAYFVAGLTLKLGDNLLDEHDEGHVAVLPLAISGVLFGMLMIQSEWDLVLFASILLGVIASGKVNRPQFLIGFGIILVILYMAGIPQVSVWHEFLALLVILFLVAVVDEKGNDWVDAQQSPRVGQFFKYRLGLKISCVLLSIVWPEFISAAVGLWCFDIGYELANLVRQV